jgi:predicted dehydrogenase
VSARRRIGVGVIGFGWLGQAHSRSLLRLPSLFEERRYDPVLVAAADPVPSRMEHATVAFGFTRGHADWRAVIDDPRVEVVWIAAPNMLHRELVEATCAAGKAVFCEKPVGGTPDDILAAATATSAAKVTSGVGYCYRWAPLVRYAGELIAAGELGEIMNYRGRFFSSSGSDPLAFNTWRFRQDEAGYGTSSDLLCHSVDLAHTLVGPITSVIATTHTFIRERPTPSETAKQYARGRPEDPTEPVTNEDYVGMLARFSHAALGTFEASRVLLGPESDNAFDVYGTRGAVGWTLEDLNSLRLYRATSDPGSGYTLVRGGDRFANHGAFVPGAGNSIGYEDLVAIEDDAFLTALADDRPFSPSFEDALAWGAVQVAILRSAETGHWEDVVALDTTPNVG